MSDAYTHTPLTEIEQVAPADGHQIRFATGALDAERTGLGLHHFAPGHRQGFGHRHDDAEEIYVIVGGSGRMKLDDDVIDVARLDAIRVAPPVVRAFEAGPDGLEVIACGARHDGDGATVPDWWTD